MTQFYSRNDVNYSGDVYSIPFDYIDKKEVKVYIDDELWTKWHFLSEHQLTLDEVPEDIRYSNIISVRRETNIKDKVVTYDNNSLLNKENLNKSQDQLLYAVQEIYDNNTQFAIDIRAEVDEKVERVSDAVEKLEFLEDSVAIANEAALEATEQAQIATEKAEETLKTYNEAMAEIDTLRQDSVDEVNQLVADHTDDLNALDQLIKKDADAIINRVGYSMFDTVVKDHILTYEESKGLALQGTWVYKTAIAGIRYGYADFYNKVVEEYNEATETETVNGVTIKVHSNGHKFYDIADKTGVDDFFNTMGTAWFYGVDTTEERVFLPRNNFFDQATGNTAEVGDSVQAGLPNITANANFGTGNTGARQSQLRSANGAFKSATTAQNAAAQGASLSGVYENLQFNASLSNPIYGNSDTVQPNAVKKLLYICVGNTVSDTSWVDVVTQVEGGVKDLEDKKNTSIAEIDAKAKSYGNLTNRQITNCITEIPQRIKYDLTDGTLTIKAGSVVIVPYGVEDLTSQYPKGATFLNDNFKVYDTQFEDGKFFVWAEVQNNIVSNNSVSTTEINQKMCLTINDNHTTWQRNTESGTSTSTATQKYTIYYNTETNLVGMAYEDVNIDYTETLSLIFLETTCLTSGAGWKSVNQVFNGMGYIGSTVWVDKGVKGLIPNGRNSDGTLNNIEIVTDKIAMSTSNSTQDYTIRLTSAGTLSQRQTRYNLTVKTLGELYALDASIAYHVHVIDENRNYYTSNSQWIVATDARIITATLTNGVVSNFQPKQPFRAVNYNDFNDLTNDVTTLQKGVGSTKAYITETYKSGSTGYRVWSDGYCEQWGKIASQGEYATKAYNLLKNFKDTSYSVLITEHSGTSGCFQAKAYSTSKSTFTLHTSAGGGQGGYNWRASGYIA